eukprot:TRINITY_DN26314_c0_g1_i1.p1 TRINITY_DN26314_c0_g1~~TRINITY_DN26314_c0_g1_i1.p1  ORF type:complete len:980 (+),score=109.25 TRINITY_DN26314_c0_g1_i1:834-3773(+)
MIGIASGPSPILSSGKRKTRRRGAFWRPSFSLGGLLLLLAIAVSLLLLRREIEVLTDLSDDPDKGDWPITHLQLRAADSFSSDELEEKGPAAWEVALEEHRRSLGSRPPPVLRPDDVRLGLSGSPAPPVPPTDASVTGTADAAATSALISDQQQAEGSGSASQALPRRQEDLRWAEEETPVRPEGEREDPAKASGTGGQAEEAGSSQHVSKRLAEVPLRTLGRTGPAGGGDPQGSGQGEDLGFDAAAVGDLVAQDVTLVICAKHRFSTTQEQLQQVLAMTPTVPILYVMSGPMRAPARSFLTEQRRVWPGGQLELRDAGPFASGFSVRNATVDLLRSKYVLFLFNDVFPTSPHWLHRLYLFAEGHPEGVAFLPFTWENRTSSAGMRLRGRSEGIEVQLGEGDSLLGHTPFATQLAFDDYGNDGKLYIDMVEGEGMRTLKGADPSSMNPLEVSASIEDHCVLVRREFLEEAVLWDIHAGFTRQAMELALTLRYWNRRAYLVPQSQVVYQPPALGLTPDDLPFFSSQTSEDVCAANLVHLRQKWGLIPGQVCRGFVDRSLRSVSWSEDDLPQDMGEQAQLVVAMFSLIGLNRFQVHHLPKFAHPKKAPSTRCRSRDKATCPRVAPWMTTASDAVGMMTAVAKLNEALDWGQLQPTGAREGSNGTSGEGTGGEESRTGTGTGATGTGANTQGSGISGISIVNRKSSGSSLVGEPQLWIGRAEIQLPLRLNRVVDAWRAAALRSGQLFPVRRGAIRRGDKHAGRRAPDLPLLMRLYLPFLLVEMELVWAPSYPQGGMLADDSWRRAMDGLSLVLREGCMLPHGSSAASQAAAAQTGPFPKARRKCGRGEEQHLRAWMFVRHVHGDVAPARALVQLKKSLLRGASPGAGGWVESSSIRKGLSGPLQRTVRRLRALACLPGSTQPCSLALPIGNWHLVQWAWRPQSVRTAQVLLLNPLMPYISLNTTSLPQSVTQGSRKRGKRRI